MTIEEKARAYDEALEDMRVIYPNLRGDAKLAVEHAFPELAKSEDERIIKTLQEYVKNRNWPLNGPTQEEVLAWLEKQKECLTDTSKTSKSEDERLRKAALEGIKYLEREMGWDTIDDIDILDVKEYLEKQKEGCPEFCNGHCVGCEKQKEQKPADLSEMMVHKEPYTTPVPTPMVADERKPVEPSGKLSRQDYLYQLLIDQLITYSDYEYLIGQNPAWSEEDERILNELITIMDGGKVTSGTYLSEYVAWLKFLPERFNLQPKQEWSEEDERKLQKCIKIVERWEEDYDIAYAPYSNTLKSLRPQSKKELSIEKAIQWLDDTFYFSDNSSGRGRDCEITTHDFDSLEEMYDSFRKAVIVDSEPSWKPTEEQIRTLDIVISDYRHACTKDSDKKAEILKPLLEQLEKL